MLCSFRTAYSSQLKKHKKKCFEVRKDLAYKECSVKLVPLDHSSLVEAFTPLPKETVKEEEPIGFVIEAVARSLKESVGIEVKRKIGEAVALSLFDQWWAKAEEQYKAVQEKTSSEKVREESSRRCHLCEFEAGSEGNLTEHLMINHVFDLE